MGRVSQSLRKRGFNSLERVFPSLRKGAPDPWKKVPPSLRKSVYKDFYWACFYLKFDVMCLNLLGNLIWIETGPVVRPGTLGMNWDGGYPVGMPWAFFCW